MIRQCPIFISIFVNICKYKKRVNEKFLCYDDFASLWKYLCYYHNTYLKKEKLNILFLIKYYMDIIYIQCYSDTQSCPTLWDLMDCSTWLPCPSLTPGACSNSCLFIQWFHPTISSSVIPFSSCLPSLPTSMSFPMSQFFVSAGQSTGVSASASVLPVNIQDWFPLGLTALISLQSKGFSRVFSNTTVQKHQFSSAQPSLWSNSHIHTSLQEKPLLWSDGPLLAK